MSEIKKLKINGQEYTITDGGAVAFDEAQELTDEQRAQARENAKAAAVHIGADEPTDESITLWVDTDEDAGSGSSPLTVTITDGVASHTSAEIYAHVLAGGTAVLDDGGTYGYFALHCYGEEVASFVRVNAEESNITQIDIYDDGSYDEYAEVSFYSRSVNEIKKIANDVFGEKVTIVTLNDDGYATHNAADIAQIVANKGRVVFFDGSYYFNLQSVDVDGYTAYFSFISKDGGLSICTINQDNEVRSAGYLSYTEYAYSKSQIDTMLGSYINDIDTLIGGES